ncbi:hypothetical protein [Bacillus sp. REN10]|uniref:hypothetical protein n=1 Tax=Bacillus sp. REN10 TaxID=2782541 RepID=UPI00193BD3EF|nr:hypothetical protein [Bacillus sp. REN10]
MSGTTPRLNLYMKDPVVDQEDTFNIETMLNGNWRKIDEKVATKEELAAAGKVQSVNGKTGAVTLTAADVGAETPVGALQQINAAIAALINGAPGALDTLEELANAMGKDPNFATTVINRIAAAEQKNTETEQKVTSHLAEDAKRIKVKTNRTISAVNWTLDSASQLYIYDLNDADITAETIVDVNIKVSDLEKAVDLKSANESFNGYVRLYAESPPAESIICDLKLIRQVF